MEAREREGDTERKREREREHPEEEGRRVREGEREGGSERVRQTEREGERESPRGREPLVRERCFSGRLIARQPSDGLGGWGGGGRRKIHHHHQRRRRLPFSGEHHIKEEGREDASSGRSTRRLVLFGRGEAEGICSTRSSISVFRVKEAV